MVFLSENEKYINPFTDYGFKRLFGEEPNKELLIDFLNELLRDEQGEIVELTYLNSEQLGRSKEDRKSLFDIYCTNEKGDKFIVELQKTKQKFFKDRTLYYSTFPIVQQANRGSNWNFELRPVYTIAILDFAFDDEEDDVANKYRYDVKLIEKETQQVFYDKYTFIYLSMPKFTKKLEELETHFEKWLYAFKHLSELKAIPDALREEIFVKFFDAAEVAHLNPDEYITYEASLKAYWDRKSELSTTLEEGFEKGREEGREEGIEIGIEKGSNAKALEIAKNLKQTGLDASAIAQITGLPLEAIEKLYE
ncbi:MAG: hypothetical protein CR974_02570 [Gammaproteobacteria bacterium]|nr:MAG: hypothetical protein CR974_02570 [Gammaproteobacteria bacterium]